jgi:hypothetical protein
MLLNADGMPHASTCPNRVHIADLGVRKRTDHVQKLIPAAAKMRAPVTIKAARGRGSRAR